MTTQLTVSLLCKTDSIPAVYDYTADSIPAVFDCTTDSIAAVMTAGGVEPSEDPAAVDVADEPRVSSGCL